MNQGAHDTLNDTLSRVDTSRSAVASAMGRMKAEVAACDHYTAKADAAANNREFKQLDRLANAHHMIVNAMAELVLATDALAA